MLTTRRPPLGPNEAVPYAYIDGKIYYNTNFMSTHPDLVRELLRAGLSQDQVKSGIYGYILNESWEEDEGPKYTNEQYSDFYHREADPEEQAQLNSMLQALFPGIKNDAGRYGKTAAYTMQHVNTQELADKEDWSNGRIPFIADPNKQLIYYGDPGHHHRSIYQASPLQEEHPSFIQLKKDMTFGFVDPNGNGKDEPAGHYLFKNQDEYDPRIIDSLKANYDLPVYHLFDAKTPQDEPDEGAYNSFFERVASGWKLADDSAILPNMSPIDSAIQNDPAAKTAISALTQAGGRVFVVGGAVRDAILGTQPKDIDLMVQGLEDDAIVAALNPLGRLDFTGKAFGVFRFKSNNSEVEIALPRTERSTGIGHKDFEVTTDPFLSPEDDLSRRDFTGNAMAYEPATGSLIDPHGGAQDLQNGTLSLVNDQAFKDDPLRIVRALVANARFGLEPDASLKQALADNAERIRHLPGERIQMELDKLLASANPAQAIQLAEQSGLIPYLFPELESAIGFDQMNPHHDLNVFDHTMQVLKAMTNLTNDPDLRLAALFHDSGKPDSFWRDETAPAGGGGHFYKKVMDDGTVKGADHEDVGADRVREFMTRLRYPNARIERVTKLVQNHMFPYFNSTKGARKFLRALDGDVKMAFDLLTLREADASGKDDNTPSNFDRTSIDKARQLLQEAVDSQGEQGFTLKDLAVNGRDMMEAGLKGPQIGQALNKLLDLVIDNPELNDHDTLMQIVQ